ncbi:MAG: carbohydrate binding domain-containing protein [Salinivirgaceae bacterium]|jgi:hypothetical protein|nr:carbohydrate binding domain-containing protein [Salinivirgaceae bacterium]
MRNYIRLSSVIVCFCITLLFTSANAVNYYVSALTGSNNNTGLSETAAFASVQKASDLTNPGDNVYIMNGTYTDVNWNSKGHQCVLTITRSGSASGGYITYKNYLNHKPKLSAVNCTWGCVEIYASYIKFEGMELEGTNSSITYDYAKSVFDEYCAGGRDWGKIAKVNINGLVVKGVDHVYLSNCIVRDFSGGGIAVERVDYAYVEYNTVYNNAWYMMYAGSGISLFHSRDIDTNTTDYKNVIRGNVCYNNKCLIPWASGSQPYSMSDGNGIILDNNTNSQISETPYNGRTLAENNICYNNGGGGVHGYTCANLDIINNTAYNNGTNMGYADIDAQSCTNSRIYNNIMYGRTGGKCNGNDAGAVYDYNVYYNGSVNKKGTHDKVVDPEFMQLPTITSGLADVTTADFRLQASSPAINNGSNAVGLFSATDILGLARPVGLSTDMGAYEYPTVITKTEINVKQGSTNIPDNTGTFDFGDVAYETPKTITYTIENTGDQVLNLTNTPRVALTGTGYSLAADAPDSIPAFGTATFQVALTTSAAAANYSGAVSIANDDLDENPYNFTLTGAGYDGTKATQTITFPALPKGTVGGANFEPEATSSVGLIITYSSSNTNVATIVDGKIHPISEGTTTITASQAGNASTNVAKNVTQLLTVIPEIPEGGSELIENSTFESGSTGWYLQLKSGAAATLLASTKTGYDGNALNINIATSGTAGDHIQTQYPLIVGADRTYTLSFKASADNTSTIKAVIMKNKSPWTQKTIKTFSLTTSPQTFTGTFTWSVAETVVLMFQMGSNSPTNIYVDDVSIKEITSAIINVKDKKQYGIEVYPNPASNLLKVNYDGAAGESGKIEIIDLVGHIVLTKSIANNMAGNNIIELNLNNIRNGIYLVKIQKKSGSVKTSKFIIRK